MNEPTKPEDRILLVLQPVADPMERCPGACRTADYRFKLVLKNSLRGYCFKRIRCGRQMPPQPPAKSEQG